MKKLLSIILVLILTLTACTTPTNTTSSDISSSQQDNVLRDYASSQEALDFVKRIAPFTAYRSYSSIDCTDYTEIPLLLANAIYEEISAVEVPVPNSNHIQIESTTVCELLTKYFGAAAVPTIYAHKSGTETITKQFPYWKIKSVELSEFSGKEAVYTVNLEYPLNDYTYVAQMHFLVLSENSETWLQLTSNTFSVKDKKEFTLEQRASALASIITANVDSSYFENDTITLKDITDTAILRFIISVANQNYNEEFEYSHYFETDFSRYFHFPQKTISQIAYEVFGREDYVFDPSRFGEFIYNEDTDEYIDLLRGVRTRFPKEVIEVTTLDDSTIVVKAKNATKVQTLRFEPIKDSDGRTFLRLAAKVTDSDEQMQDSSTSSEHQNNDIVSYELPNGWNLQDFTIAGFDKEGPGDFGYLVTMNEEQLSRFCELMDVEKWQEFNTPIERGVWICLRMADEGMERTIAIAEDYEFGTIIIILKGASEKTSYIAPARVAVDVEELADELRAQIKKTSDSNY